MYFQFYLVLTWSDGRISFVLTNVTADYCWLFSGIWLDVAG